MGHENNEGVLIRRYLLGQVSEDERQQLEERIMTDTELFNRVLLAEDDLTEQYVRKEMTEQDRLRFEEVFLATKAGWRQVDFNRAFYKYIGSSAIKKRNPFGPWIQDWPRGIYSTQALKWAAMVALAVAAVWAVWFAWVREDPVAEGRAALTALYLNQRPTHSRVSGFQYAPFVELMGNDGTPTNRVQRDRAGLLVQNAANQNPQNARAIHLLGQYYLSIGDFDGAITQLRKAHELAPNDSKILSDLGGALFEKTRSQGLSSANNAVLDECLRSLNRAVEINPSLSEAYFNRALCNELLMQWESSEADWRQYLLLDSTSPWAAEAREGLQRIEEQKRRSEWDEPRLFNDFIDAAATQNRDAGWRALSISIGTRSSHIVERLIDESFGGQAGGNDHQTLLKWAGQIALAETGDPLIADVAARYARASRADLLALQETRRKFSEGVVLFQEWKLRDACHAFENAAVQFEKLGDSAEASYARYLEAHCYLRLPELEAARDLFNDLERTAQAKKYRWLESRADDGLAELYFSRSEYSRAIEFARRSLELSR
ncbi:MAG TPA: tetratricopeptide repeat protein, partial [Blastocatellia bacterium]|nr:tetratricopeptide repeat protein [Blastocatellia bacterium]